MPMDPEPTDVDCTVTLRGRLKPGRVMPHALGVAGLLSDQDLAGAKILMATEDFARFALPWTSVTATDKTVEFELIDSRGFDRLLDFLVAFPLDLEPEQGEPDSVTRIDLTRATHYKLPGRIDANKRMLALVDGSLFRPDLQPRGLSRLQFMVSSGTTRASSVVVQSEPSRRPGSSIYLSSTVRWDASGKGKASYAGSSVLGIATKHWADAVALTERHLTWALEDLSSLWATRNRS